MSHAQPLARPRVEHPVLARLWDRQQFIVCVSALLLVSVLVPHAARATPISFTLIAPGVASPGSSLTFTGRVTNTSGVALNATDLFFDFSGYDASVLDFTQLLGVPDFILPNNTLSQVVDLFSVGVALAAQPGSYGFSVTLQDVFNDSSDLVGSSVSVAGDAAAVPEPSTFFLTLAGIAILAQRRRKARMPHTSV